MTTPADILRLQDAVNRRVFLGGTAGGLGATALAVLLGGDRALLSLGLGDATVGEGVRALARLALAHCAVALLGLVMNRPQAGA